MPFDVRRRFTCGWVLPLSVVAAACNAAASLNLADPVEMSIQAGYDDQASAARLKTMLDFFVASRKLIPDMPAEWTAIWDGYKSSLEDKTVTASLTVKVDAMVNHLQGAIAPRPAP